MRCSPASPSATCRRHSRRRSARGLPERGVVVTEIAGTAPAARFGFLRPGDLIEAIDGVAVRTSAEAAAAARIGNPSVRVTRGGQRAECGVVQGQLACRS